MRKQLEEKVRKQLKDLSYAADLQDGTEIPPRRFDEHQVEAIVHALYRTGLIPSVRAQPVIDFGYNPAD